MTPPTLVVDWDGTLTQPAYPRQGDWMPGAVDAMRRLTGYGRVVVHSCRTAPCWPDERPKDPEPAIRAMRRMLDSAGLYAVEIHAKPWKPSGVAYVDDKAVPYTGDWALLGPYLARLLVQAAA